MSDGVRVESHDAQLFLAQLFPALLVRIINPPGSAKHKQPDTLPQGKKKPAVPAAAPRRLTKPGSPRAQSCATPMCPFASLPAPSSNLAAAALLSFVHAPILRPFGPVGPSDRSTGTAFREGEPLTNTHLVATLMTTDAPAWQTLPDCMPSQGYHILFS
ncbi:hypothetical protein CDD82_4274 [Ophiocordyceps australis]|uniref:Uncharacterized protein n=1 Tax=Ophiocordyceps australis TaxID=1399860 RepID=A0A2C5Z9J6_9HYPO|nr:hypothetical protein CDD82_4274 [Ophiocordyceps australis]